MTIKATPTTTPTRSDGPGRRWLRPTPKPKTPSVSQPDRPTQLRAGTRIHPPINPGAPWILQQGEHRYFRVSADLARLAGALDGSRSSAQLSEVLGGAWTPEAVDTGVAVLTRAEVIEDEADPARRRRNSSSRRLRYVPPLSLQFTVVRSGAGIAQHVNAAITPVWAWLRLVLSGLAIAGAVVFTAHWRDIGDLLGRSAPLSTVVVLLVATGVSTALHELGHAVLLSRQGGRPGRMGFMLLYFSPTFFCDVSDAWRLSRNAQRVRVALVGIAVQIWISMATCLALLAPLNPDQKQAVALFTVVNLVAGLVNLLPFIKLDGYIALMSHLDRPNLRREAMTAVRETLLRPLVRHSAASETSHPAWLVWFGVGCAVAPVVLVVRGLGRWLSILLSLGAFGVFLSGLIASFVLALLIRWTWRVGVDLVRRKVRPVRATAALAGLALAAFSIAALPVADTETAGFVRQADGRLTLLRPYAGGTGDLAPGTSVELITAGVVFGHDAGWATVGTGPATASEVPLSLLTPIRYDGLTVPARASHLRPQTEVDVNGGTARIQHGDVSLWQWACDRFIVPSVQSFQGQR